MIPYAQVLPNDVKRQVELGHAVASATGGVGGGVRRQRRRALDPIVQAVGALFVMRRAESLTGLSRGRRKELGRCVMDGRSLSFDFWFPHLGIAVDSTPPEHPESELQAKRVWCQARQVIYGCVPTGDVMALDALARCAEARRRELLEAADVLQCD